MGKNGAGKTTLIKAITENVNISEGKIYKYKTSISYFPKEVLLFH